MARGTDPVPEPDPIRLHSNSIWYDIPPFVLNQRRRQRHPGPGGPGPRGRQERIADLDVAIARNPNASQPVTGQQNNSANLPALPNVRAASPPAQGTPGPGLPPTRLQQQMIQAYLNMLTRRR